MLIRQSFDSRFVSKIKDIEDKYGVEMLELDGIGPSTLDINQFAKKFFNNKIVADISVDANANVHDQSVLSFEYEFSKSIQKLNAYYVLWKKMVNSEYGIKRANKILEMCISGSLKIHDLQFFLKPYCYAFTLSPLVKNGLPFVESVKIGPPKHFTSYINHIIQFTAFCSNQLAGAIAFPDLFIYMDWFARKDFGEDYLENKQYKEIVQQNIQSLVYSWNYPYRGSQSAFCNVSIFDDPFLHSLFGDILYPDFSTPNIESIKKLQEFYINWFMNETKTQTFTFPVNTAVFYKDDAGNIIDGDFLEKISALNAYNGMFNIYTGPLSSLSSCCRLRSDASQVPEYMNSFGSGGVSIGSHRVVTLNLPRIGYEAEDDAAYMKILEYNIKAAQDILDIHKKLLIENIKNNRLPLYSHGFMNIDKQFSTVGFIGINEACELQGYDILDEKGTQFAKDILNKINDMNTIRSKEDGCIRNVEQIPGESAAIMFAKKDKKLFSNHKYAMYANQYIPLWKNVDIEDRITAQGIFDSQCGGGAIAHLNVAESIEPNQMKAIIKSAAKRGVIYFAININMARCNTCNKLYIGKFEKSPCHNADVTNYLRVVGFLVPVKNWASERREEYKIRQFYEKSNF